MTVLFHHELKDPAAARDKTRRIKYVVHLHSFSGWHKPLLRKHTYREEVFALDSAEATRLAAARHKGATVDQFWYAWPYIYEDTGNV